MGQDRTGAWRGNAITFFLATLGSLYAGEALLYWFDRSFVDGLPAAEVEARCPGPAAADRRCLAAIRDGVPFDSRSALEVFDEHATRGDTIWPAVPARAFAPDEGLDVPGESSTRPTIRPLAGISATETLLCNESGEWVTYEADEHGLSNPHGIHGLDGVTLALVGDSFVHGWCVPRPESLAGLLEPRWGPVLNLGLEASGPLSQLGLLREYGSDLAPDIVLWVFFPDNDMGDLEREAEVPVLLRYLNAGFRQGLKDQQPVIDEGLRSLIVEERSQDDERAMARARMLRESRLGRDSQLVAWMKLRRIRVRFSALFLESGPERDYPFHPELFSTVMARARDDVAAWGGDLFFVYLPGWWSVVRPDDGPPHRDGILETVRELGIPIVDPTPAFLRHPDPDALFPFGIEGHYTEEGFRLLAEEIEAALIRLGIEAANRG